MQRHSTIGYVCVVCVNGLYKHPRFEVNRLPASYCSGLSLKSRPLMEIKTVTQRARATKTGCCTDFLLNWRRVRMGTMSTLLNKAGTVRDTRTKEVEARSEDKA